MNITNHFIQQSAEDSELANACGAFCIKYWQWHSNIEDFRAVNQRNAVLDVYKRIQFGSLGEKLNFPQEYSNPLMICKEYNGYYIYDTRNEYFASCVKLMAEQIPSVTVVEKELVMKTEQYAMLIVENGGGGYHYILIYRKSDDEYYYHDPLKSFPLTLINGIPKLWDDIDKNSYKYTGAGIVLPKIIQKG